MTKRKSEAGPDRLCATCRERKPQSEYPSWTARRCTACWEKQPRPGRTCMTCNVFKKPTLFSATTARRCNRCWQKEVARAVCAICGAPSGMRYDGFAPREICSSEECINAHRQARFQEANRARTAEVLARTEKTCPWCKVTKPTTREFWAPGTRKSASQMFDVYCLQCRAAIQRDRDRQRRGRATVAHERIRAGGRPDSRAFPALPAEPLHHAIVRLSARHPEGLRGYCASIGISDHDVRAWKGARSSVQFDVADRALTNMGLFWWDVFPPGTAEGRIAAFAFEGTGTA